MTSIQNLLSNLPSVEYVLEHNKNGFSTYPYPLVLESIRETISDWREKLKISKKSYDKKELFNLISNDILELLQVKTHHRLQPVINATGIIIHTNLGRSLLAESALENLLDVAKHYSTLEYNLEKGERGTRYQYIEPLLTRLTGAEAGLIVNNNAAAVLLVLNTLADGKGVIISRGELIEIGGSFRLPNVMDKAGAKMLEVGTTNKTHLYDYENAISSYEHKVDIALILKVHTSNYSVQGFTSSVDTEQLVSLGKKYNIPVFEDLGSGALIDLRKIGLSYEPTVQETVRKGVDIITFSGDKLLGGPQAGIIIGKKKIIEQLKSNPLTRALRVDKFTLAALESTLRLYLEPDKAIKQIPTLYTLALNIETIRERTKNFAEKLKSKIGKQAKIESIAGVSQAGGGSLPLEELPTILISIQPLNITPNQLEKKLREIEPPIIIRIQNESLILDLRTVNPTEENYIIESLEKLIVKSE